MATRVIFSLLLLCLTNLALSNLCTPWLAAVRKENAQDLEKEMQGVVSWNYNKDTKIYFSLCDKKNVKTESPLVCNSDSGICCTKKINGKEALLWEIAQNYDPEFEFDKDRAILRAESQQNCTEQGASPNEKYAVEIIFICPDDDSTDRILFSLSSSTACRPRISWQTSLACNLNTPTANETSNDNTGDIVGSKCSVVNPKLGYTYHIEKLAQTITKRTDRGDFNVTVCKEAEFPCGKGVGGCLTNGSSSFSYGRYNDNLIYRNGTLLLSYTGGDVCDRDGKSNRSTLIQFICDTSTESDLTLIETHTDCTAHFHWKTNAACTPGRSIGCKTTDGKGNTYDLSRLKSVSSNHEVEHENTTYLINVCHTIIFGYEAECPTYSAACMRSFTNGELSYKSLGTLESTPFVDSDGILKIKYTNGGICPEESNKSLSTAIEFKCAKDTLITAPQFVSYRDCTYFFFWEDEAACPFKEEKTNLNKEVLCHIDSVGGHIDLTGLARKFVGYTVTNDEMPEAKFQLNVCKPLLTESNECDGAAACLTLNGKIMSIGRAVSSPVAVVGGAELLYTHGDQCEDDKNYNYSTRIKFRCDETKTTGRPTLERYSHDCQYIFDWPTKHACPHAKKLRDVPTNCVLEDELYDRQLDLSGLKSLPEFKNRKICTVESRNSVYEILPETVVITQTTEEICSTGGQRAIEFLVQCDKDAQIPIEQKVKDYPCLLIMEVHTSIVCANEESDKGHVFKEVETDESGSGNAAGWAVLFLAVGGLSFVTYKRRRTIASLWSRFSSGQGRPSRDGSVRYSEVPTNDETRLIFGPVDPRNLHDDSDDELLGV
ncbi:cation-independent mannose-6-phosphate receptor-like [Artemia franciscana]